MKFECSEDVKDEFVAQLNSRHSGLFNRVIETPKMTDERDYANIVASRDGVIVRDEEDWLTISEKKHQETEKHYSDTYDLVSRYKIDGNPLRNYIDAITIEKYVPLLQI